ncbi:hypothetical protein PR048_033640 [Dryococelus australis]|uniref:Uncharacterized protein n=1 Tax=Dryococelus australis TaxID=614101 RepID=A0ABQ9G518_9NEOP|nr:hypothetical protein PR048_033640 [Dryococelus australis]
MPNVTRNMGSSRRDYSNREKNSGWFHSMCEAKVNTTVFSPSVKVTFRPQSRSSIHKPYPDVADQHIPPSQRIVYYSHCSKITDEMPHCEHHLRVIPLNHTLNPSDYKAVLVLQPQRQNLCDAVSHYNHIMQWAREQLPVREYRKDVVVYHGPATSVARGSSPHHTSTCPTARILISKPMWDTHFQLPTKKIASSHLLESRYQRQQHDKENARKQRLPRTTMAAYGVHISVPNFISFLERHCRAQEMVGLSQLKGSGSQTYSSCYKVPPMQLTRQKPPNPSKHQSNESRYLVSSTQSCLNKPHKAKNCPSTLSFPTCGGKPHTLLHFEPKCKNQGSESDAVPTSGETASTLSAAMSAVVNSDKTALLSTAQVEILNPTGSPRAVWALLHTATQVSFIPEGCLQKLRFRCNNGLQFALEVFVLPELRCPLKFVVLCLADPSFDMPGSIDHLIGADLLPQLMTGGPTSCSRVYVWVG